MPMLRKLLPLILLVSILSGCAPGSATPVPTLLPESLVPTIIAMTADSARATLGAQTPTAVESTPTATATLTPAPTRDYPTQTFTPQPHIPLAQVQFLSPGPMSKFISPVQVQLMVVAGESDKIQIDLFDETGVKIGSKIDHVNRQLAGVYAVYKIPFEIRAAAEKGLLQVSSRDKEGRMQALNSVPIVLLSAGETRITPPGNFIYERAVFYTPRDEDSVSGGELTVKGRFWPFNTQPAFLELILPDGRAGALRVLSLQGLDPQEFSTTLPYKVSEPTLARLSLRQMDPVLNAPIYVFTQAIWLKP
ncbi:MAG: hypothetical protein ACM3QS_08340 [Bacteroidota bacterium]